MGVSITIQTYNRADELRRTLLTLSQIETNGAPAYEVLVIDNNSQDRTPDVVEELTPLFGGLLRYVREPRQGLSHARNRAVAEARHEIVAFLDDDVDVDRNWLVNLAAAFQGSDWAAIGGKAYLVYPGPKPGWLDERSEGLLTRMDYGPVPRPAQPDELFGVNLSFRKDWLERVGGFRTDLGRVGTCLLGSEETELLDRIVQAGGKLLYEPAAIVGHRAPPARLRRRWFWSRCYWGHRGVARMLPETEVSCYELLRATWHVALMCGRLLRSAIAHGPRSAAAFVHTRDVATRLGAWVGLLGRVWGRFRPHLPRATPGLAEATAKT